MEDIFQKYTENNKIKDSTPPLFRAIIIAYTVQGIIDNGGFQYLFENDFVQGDHSNAVWAFKHIGAHEHSEKIQYVLNLFPGGVPQLNLKERNNFIERRINTDTINDTERKNSDVYKIENYFWDNSELIYKRLDELTIQALDNS